MNWRDGSKSRRSSWVPQLRLQIGDAPMLFRKRSLGELPVSYPQKPFVVVLGVVVNGLFKAVDAAMVLTLWLSITAAVGDASRRRHIGI